MRDPDLVGWIDASCPPVPDAFRPHLLASAGKAFVPTVEGLLAQGETALRRALAQPDTVDGAGPVSRGLDGGSERDPRPRGPGGGGRATAFHLLAADAWVTWAAEAALEAEDPDAVLEEMALRLARRTPSDGGGV